MKVGILAGGLGSRMGVETVAKPKPMVEVAGRPLLWHVMAYYSCFDHKDFVIALGYKAEVIKRYMVDFVSLNSNLTVNLKSGTVEAHGGLLHDWNVDLIDTGLDSTKARRIKLLAPYLAQDGTFMLTWGDGLSNIDINGLLEFHRSHGKLATLTAARPAARFGHLEFEGDKVVEFNEKPQTSEGWVNGAFFVLEPGVIDYIQDEELDWEQEALQNLAADGELMAFKHEGFWQGIDTIRDIKLMNRLWDSGEAPWKIWD